MATVIKTHGSHKLVSGYIHRMEKDTALNIPAGIIEICLLYLWRFFDSFGHHGKNITTTLSDDDYMHMINCTSSDANATAFGWFTVDCKELPKYIVEWIFKIHNDKQELVDLAIGIIAIDDKSHHKQYWNAYPFGPDNKVSNYGIWIDYGAHRLDVDSFNESKSKNEVFNDNFEPTDISTIRMCMDIGHETLEFYFNDMKIETYKNVKCGCMKYQMAVSLCGKSSLEISKFEVRACKK